ncbi:hypothetical protein BB559_007554 [Furculomyces boomerangus]|uniref:Uncharacterized protein n=2 Tax=Harpellales TaxID=61421 RepID=A0A2T9XWW6_9FUNG|nr:hypothetical protein BB559_007554 [Furculomyces boomerangus]PVZ98528.1 hypothetical protein BB558_005467 [Smittium angustum]
MTSPRKDANPVFKCKYCHSKLKPVDFYTKVLKGSLSDIFEIPIPESPPIPNTPQLLLPKPTPEPSSSQSTLNEPDPPFNLSPYPYKGFKSWHWSPPKVITTTAPPPPLPVLPSIIESNLDEVQQYNDYDDYFECSSQYYDDYDYEPCEFYPESIYSPYN